MIFYVIPNFSEDVDKEKRRRDLQKVSKANWRSKWALRGAARGGGMRGVSGASKTHKAWLRGHKKKLRKSYDITKKFGARFYKQHGELP